MVRVFTADLKGFSPLKKWGIVQTRGSKGTPPMSFSPLKKWGIVQMCMHMK